MIYLLNSPSGKVSNGKQKEAEATDDRIQVKTTLCQALYSGYSIVQTSKARKTVKPACAMNYAVCSRNIMIYG